MMWISHCPRCGGTHLLPRDNTELGHELAILETDDPEVRKAGEQLDETIADISSGRAAERDKRIREIYG